MRAQIMNLLVQLLFLTFQYFKERQWQKTFGHANARQSNLQLKSL